MPIAASGTMSDPVASTPLAEDRAAGETALLVIDMLSDWSFSDGDTLLAEAQRIAPAIEALARRCREVGIPVVFCNDNHGRWRSDLREVVATAKSAGGPGSDIACRLEPQRTDYIVLKPKHSGFHATPLDLLLRHLGVKRLLLTGVSSDQCVLYTAADAKMNDYDISVPADCVATLTAHRQEAAMRHFADVLGAGTQPSAELQLPPGTAR